MRRPIPAPQVIDGEEWQVRDSGHSRTAFVDFESKTMVVPMDESEIGNLLRAHETMHVAITPRDGELMAQLNKEFPNRNLQAAEDARVYIALQKAGINTDVSHWPEVDIEKVSRLNPLDANQREEMVRCLIATKGTADHDKIREVMPESVVELADSLYDKHFAPYVERGEIPPFEATVEMGREMHYSVEETEEESGDGEGEPGEEPEGSSSEMKSESGGKESKSKDARRPDTGTRRGEDKYGYAVDVPKEEEIARPFVPGDIENESSKPKVGKKDLTKAERELIREVLGEVRTGNGSLVGTCEIRRPKLSRQHKGKGFGRKTLNADTGSIPRRMNRLATDGAVFSRTIKGGFGTVLIDVSGSMSLDEKDVEKIVEALPNSTIACYSGPGAYGAITILAEGGKRVETIPAAAFMGGNVVDFQAIEWLAKQRKPRYWICDGAVTGGGDSLLSPLLQLKLARVAYLNRIERFRNLDSLLKKIGGKGK